MSKLLSESLSPYLEPPSIPEGVTVDEYRRTRPPKGRRRRSLRGRGVWLAGRR